MRILHTSDWHLGRSFHREGLLGHQAAYVDHLLEVIDAEDVDVVVVSGDIYDRALPPVDAVRLADETFARIAASRARLVVTSGNHDSAQRLGFGARLIDAAGVHVRTDPAGVGTPVVIADRHGDVLFYPLPWLEPEALRLPWSLPGRSHEAALAEAMRRVRADLGGRSGARSVLMAHAFVAGCAPSDSERDIAVGGVSMVSADLFAGIDYVALGHLHRANEVTSRVRYSGSPLAYSFSEADQVKGSWLVDLAADGAIATEFVPAPVPRSLARLRGKLDELLADPAYEPHQQSWVQVTLTDERRPTQAMERLRRRFPHTLHLAFEPSGRRPAATFAPSAEGRSDHEMTLDFVAGVRGVAASARESALLRRAVEACCADPSAPADRSEQLELADI